MRSFQFMTVGLLALTVAFAACADLSDDLEKISLPPGFSISVYADGLTNARSMVRGEHGTLFVATMRAGKVYAVQDTDSDNRADRIYTILDGGTLSDGTRLMMPNGVAFKDGSLYVGAVSHILRFDHIESRLESPGEPVIVTSQFPTERMHSWKYIAFDPDGKLTVPVGAWCNICDNESPYFATINRINPDGSGLENIAQGVRNTVGFDWHPDTGELWFTDNGRDRLGDDLPADELNRVTQAGQHFGYPYIHQGDTPDVRYGRGHNASEFVKPQMKLGPHVAALGMKFYTGGMFPAEYKNQIFIAEHGSWDRSKKSGYRITLVKLNDAGDAESYSVFAEGWLAGQNYWGRPTDILIMPDGALLVSDDQAGAIYRISYDG